MFLFYSKLKDLIVVKNNQYQNASCLELWGTEFEFEQSIGNWIKFNTNFSYVHTKEKQTDLKLPQIANILGTFGIMYVPHRNCNLALLNHYVGERERESQDFRDDFDSYITTDLTINIFDIGYPGLNFKAGLKNIFDSDVRYPAPLDKDLFAKH